MAKWVKGETVRKEAKLDSDFSYLLPVFPFHLFLQVVVRCTSYFGGKYGFRSQFSISHR